MVDDDRAHELTPAIVPAELRQDGIRDVVLERGFVRVADLADAFGVSTVTVLVTVVNVFPASSAVTTSSTWSPTARELVSQLTE